jgi:hypothetical protein
MYPKWLDRLAGHFEKLLIWLAEGGAYPYGAKKGPNGQSLSDRDNGKKG